MDGRCLSKDQNRERENFNLLLHDLGLAECGSREESEKVRNECVFKIADALRLNCLD